MTENEKLVIELTRTKGTKLTKNEKLVIEFLISGKNNGKFSDKTIIGYWDIMKSFFSSYKNKPIAKIDVPDINIWLNTCKPNRSQASNRLFLSVIGSFLKYCRVSRYVPRDCNPIEELQSLIGRVVKNKYESLEIEEVKKVLRMTLNPRDKAIILSLALTGARLSECKNILLEDVNFNEGYLWLRHRKGSRNGDKDTKVPMTNELISVLKSYISIRPNGTDNKYLFVGYYSNELTVSRIQQIVKKAGIRAGLDSQLHPHRFRYFFTSELAKAGCLPAVIKKLRADSDKDMIDYYSILDWNTIRSEYLKCIPSLL